MGHPLEIFCPEGEKPEEVAFTALCVIRIDDQMIITRDPDSLPFVLQIKFNVDPETVARWQQQGVADVRHIIYANAQIINDLLYGRSPLIFEEKPVSRDMIVFGKNVSEFCPEENPLALTRTADLFARTYPQYDYTLPQPKQQAEA